MIYFNSILGLPIIDSDTGLRISVVKDVLFDESKKRISGILLEDKGLLNVKKYIPVEEIVELDKTSIKIHGNSSIKVVSNDKTLEKGSLQEKIDSEVYQSNGRKVGYVSDITFNFETGVIESFIISDGVVEDLISGRRMLKSDKDVNFKGSKVFIS